MYQIGEFSRITFITIKALRYYDKIDLLKPANINEENGYRYYDTANYHQAMLIKTLRNYDFGIKEIQEILPNILDEQDLVTYLQEKHLHLSHKIKKLEALQSSIDAQITSMKEVIPMLTTPKIEVLELAPKNVAIIRYKGKYEEVGHYIGQLYKHIGMKGLSQPFSLYYDDSYTEENADVGVAVEIKGEINNDTIKTITLAGGTFASITHIGSYETLSESYKALSDYMQEKGYTYSTPSREIYIKGPGMLFKGNPNKYQTQILFPIVK